MRHRNHKFLNKFLHSLILPAIIGLTGCFSPVHYGKDLDEQAKKTEYTYGDIAFSGNVRDKWWEAYGNSELNGFVDVVLEETPTILSAYLRMLDSEMALEQATSNYYPNLNLTAGVGYGGRVQEENSTHDPSYSLGLSLSYEVDLWGKVRAQKRISELSYLSVEDSAESALLSLVGNVVTSWFNILYYRDRKVLSEQLLELSEDYYLLVQEYYKTGQTNGMDLLEQRQQIESLRSTIAQYDTNIRIAAQSLAILSNGKSKPAVEGSMPDAIDVGGTVDVQTLITSRPDIRSARRSAEQADAQIVIAIADRLPSLRLSASMSFRSNAIADLFKALIWDLAANFTANLFDGFQKTTAIKRAKVSYLSQRLSYALTVMQAVSEVEQALLELRLREQLLVDAKADLERRKEILETSRDYFTHGMIDYNRVLSALRSMISSSQSELDARHNLLNAQIALFKAMGGSKWLEDARTRGKDKARELLDNIEDG